VASNEPGLERGRLAPSSAPIEIRNLLVLCAVCVSALVLPLFSGMAFARQEPAWTVSVQPPRVRQGGLLFVSLQTTEPIRDPWCEWLGQRYPMFAAKGGYRAALPVDRLQKTGLASLAVHAAGIAEPLATRSLQIVALNTGPIQTVRLTPEVMKAEQDPRIEEESKRIRALVSTQTGTPQWGLGFKPPVAAPGKNFGTRRHYVEILADGKRGSSFDGYHRGLDFPVGAGSPVHAAAAGVVLAAELFVLSGNSVLIDHGQGLITGYFHLSEFRVKVGQKIKQGEVVGLVGSTGRSTGPHLHWSVYAQGRTVNPTSILQLPAFFRIEGLRD